MAGAAGLSSLEESSTIPLSSFACQQAKLLFPAYLCKRTLKYPRPRQPRYGEHSATARHKTSINQCQPWALTRTLLSAQPLNHIVFSWLLRQPLTETCLSPLPKGEGKRELVENKDHPLQPGKSWVLRDRRNDERSCGQVKG